MDGILRADPAKLLPGDPDAVGEYVAKALSFADLLGHRHDGLGIPPRHFQPIGILLGEQAVLVAFDDVADDRPHGNGIQAQVVADLVDLDDGGKVVIEEVRPEHGEGLVLWLVTDPVIELQGKLCSPLYHFPSASNGTSPAGVGLVALEAYYSLIADFSGTLRGKVDRARTAPVLDR